MKKTNRFLALLMSTVIAASSMLSGAPAVFAEDVTEVDTITAAEEQPETATQEIAVIPEDSAVSTQEDIPEEALSLAEDASPTTEYCLNTLSLLTPLEAAKTGVTNIEKKGVENTVSVVKYTGSDAATGTIIENNIYHITNTYPDIYANTYKFAEVVYYYETDSITPVTDGMQITIGTTKNVSSGSTSVFANATYSSNEPLVTDRWASQIIDLSAFGEAFPDAVAAGFAYNHIRLRPFGSLKNSQLHASDKIYIKEINFFTEAPVYRNTCDVYYYATEEQAEAGGNDYIAKDTWEAYAPNDVKKLTYASVAQIRWISTEGAEYMAGHKYSDNCSKNLYLYPASSESAVITYVNPEGVIEGIKQNVFTDISLAMAKIDGEEGIIYVSGSTVLPDTIGIKGGKKVTICGYNGTSDIITASLSGTRFLSDVTFKNITLKAQAIDERWVSATDARITLEKSCQFETSDPYLYGGKNVSTGLYLGANSERTGRAYYNLCAPGAVYTMMAPVAGYGGSYNVRGDVVYDLNGGTYASIFGGVRNGASNAAAYQTLYGDVTYNLNSGVYRSIHTNNNSGGNVVGNIVFNINGGIFDSSTFNFGSVNKDYAEKSSAGSIALVINADKLVENGNSTAALPIAEKNDYASIPKNNTIVIFNHIENANVLPTSVTMPSADYLISVVNGSAQPVFAESYTSGAGKLLGFDIQSSTPGYAPYIGDTRLFANEYGLYTIPKTTNGAFTEITFRNSLEGIYFMLHFDTNGGTGSVESIKAEGNTVVNLPSTNLTKDGYIFGGWSFNDEAFGAGTEYLVAGDALFSAVWIEESAEVTTVYVDGIYGNDGNFGGTSSSALKSFSAAIAKADAAGAEKIIIMSTVVTDISSLSASDKRLTFTSYDGKKNYGGTLVINTAFKINRPVTFEYLNLGCRDYQHICTGNSHVIFGDGISAADDTKGIYLHMGNQHSAGKNVNVEIRSGKFACAYFGGAYFKTDGVTGLNGDALLTLDGVSDFKPTFGFDGYTGNNGKPAVDGSMAIIVNSGSVSGFSTAYLSGITGSIYVISRKGSSVSGLASLPQAQKGNYIINVVGSNGTVTPAYNTDGRMIAGSINAVCDNADYKVKITNGNGFETVYEQGDIALTPGSYVVEFVEIEAIIAPNFIIQAPVAGFSPENKTYVTSSYIAQASWYEGALNAKKHFELGKTYTVKINVRPYNFVDTSSFTSARVNNSRATVTKNFDETFTVSYTFGSIGVERKKYVSSTTGSDSNSGTQAAPYATLKKAVSSIASNGGVIYICDEVSAALAMPTHKKPILITGEGFNGAKLVLGNNLGFAMGGDVTIDNLTIEMGDSSHINDRGHKLVFGDGVILEQGRIFHLGPYLTGNNYPSIDSCDVTAGSGTNLGGVSVGGGYITNAAEGIAGDAKITLNGGRISSLLFGVDQYDPSHTSAVLNGNFLLTVNHSGTIDRIATCKHPLITSENTVYQFIYNFGARPTVSVDPAVIPADKLYIVCSAVGGRVEHALDSNGRSIGGVFDIVPDKGYMAIIKRSDYTTFTYGGRYSLPAGEIIEISYFKNEYALESLVVELNGGNAQADMYSIDENGCIHFNASPVKEGFIFEGWYSDSGFKNIVADGSFVGSNCSLYAKYATVSTAGNDAKFTVRGIQMRVPVESENIIQGLRFITTIDNSIISTVAAFSSKNSSDLRPTVSSNSSYGTVVIPADKLGNNELVIDGSYKKDGRQYRAKTVFAENLFSQSSDVTEYTACITKIKEENYMRGYTVRPYIRYYTRSGNLTTAYAQPYTVSVMDATYAVLEGGAESSYAQSYLRDNILSVHADMLGIEFIPTDVLNSINQKTAQYKQNVVNSPNMSLSGVTGKVYYVSPDGNDSNNGTSTSTPWKSIAKVNSVSFKSGDVVLFRRNSEFRGKITARQGVTYSAYGTGSKPVINGSARDYADASLWQATDIENVYKLTSTIKNVGLIVFDYNDVIGDYDQKVGIMRVSGVTYNGELFTNQFDLKRDLEFYSNLTTNELYLYSAEGNPGTRFKSIEIANVGNLVSPKSDITVDNLTFINGGGHGVGAGGGTATYDANGNFVSISGHKNLTVKNCIFAWIGGSILMGYNDANLTRYGNAVEVYGSADGYTVDNCWIYQIYDTGVTHQMSASSTGHSMQQNVVYSNNLIEYCHWSIEFYNQPCCDEHYRITRHILAENNIVRMGGYGWGSTLRPTGATLYNSFGLSRIPEHTYDFVARNNIFFRSAGPIFRINTNASEDNLEYESNIYVQDYNKFFSWYKGAHYNFDKEVGSLISGDGSQIKETNNAGFYYYAP